MKNFDKKSIINMIHDLQKAIAKKSYYKELLCFSINKEGLVKLAPPRNYTMKDDGKDKYLEAFEGASAEEAFGKLFDFVSTGGKIRISCDENNYQFKVIFSYKDDTWVIDNITQGNYAYIDSFDD